MLQELTYGRLENEFYDLQPQNDDLVICVKDNRILVCRTEENKVVYPTVAKVKCWEQQNGWLPWKEEHFQYIFKICHVVTMKVSANCIIYFFIWYKYSYFFIRYIRWFYEEKHWDISFY